MQRATSDKARDHRRSAQKAGLRYGSDREPGIRREYKGSKPHYYSARAAECAIANSRANSSLAIPPAWKDVSLRRMRTTTCRRQAATRKGASNIAIIRGGAKCEGRASMPT